MLFVNVSPDPKLRDDRITATPFWQIFDILSDARYILRRRNSDEVMERAGFIRTKIQQYESDIVEVAERLGQPIPMRMDDASLLHDLIMPNRAFPFRAPRKGEDSNLPFVVVEGWIEAEDFAVLTLLKVDQAIDALNDETPADQIVHCGLLLEAFQCLLLAERAGGREVRTSDEKNESMQRYNDAKKLRIKDQCSIAGKSHLKDMLRIKFVEIYFNQLKSRPAETMFTLADEITDKYLASYPLLHKDERLLLETNAHRTVRGWIKAAIADKKSKQNLADTPKQARKELRNQNKF